MIASDCPVLSLEPELIDYCAKRLIFQPIRSFLFATDYRDIGK